MYIVDNHRSINNFHIYDGHTFYLHSDGRALSTVEYWPTRADAEAVLAKYPDAAPPVTEPEHIWKHGDIFKLETKCIMIYFKAFNQNPQVQFISRGFSVSRPNDVEVYLKDAKFLFNINDVIKERRAAKAKSWDKQEAANVVDIINMQEFIGWAKNRLFCNSGMHICDRLANQFEAALARQGDER